MPARNPGHGQREVDQQREHRDGGEHASEERAEHAEDRGGRGTDDTAQPGEGLLRLLVVGRVGQGAPDRAAGATEAIAERGESGRELGDQGTDLVGRGDDQHRGQPDQDHQHQEHDDGQRQASSQAACHEPPDRRFEPGSQEEAHEHQDDGTSGDHDRGGDREDDQDRRGDRRVILQRHAAGTSRLDSRGLGHGCSPRRAVGPELQGYGVPLGRGALPPDRVRCEDGVASFIVTSPRWVGDAANPPPRRRASCGPVARSLR